MRSAVVGGKTVAVVPVVELEENVLAELIAELALAKLPPE